MDKYEYKIRSDEIKRLISEGEFAKAVSIADTIDWRRVKSVMMLCTISDLYKINRRYQESKDILLMAYDKHPTGRLIVYSLCELSIKMEEYVQAIEYYKEFSQIAPKDTGRYILQYRLYEAQDVSLEERIAVLEEFKKRDYREKWAYELAYLYHRIGLSTKCVEECDEMFLWFGEGKYVIKALELKALHEPLSAEQQARYEGWIRERDAENNPPEEEPFGEESDINDISGDTQVAGRIRHAEEEDAGEQIVPAAPTMELPEVKTVDVGQYNTINLQMALAESMKEILQNDEEADEGEQEEEEEQPSIAESLIAPLLEETVEMPAAEEVEERLQEAPVIQFPGQPEEEPEQQLINPEELEPELEAFVPEEDDEQADLQSDEQPDIQSDEQHDKKMTIDTGELWKVSTQIAQEDTAAFDAQQIVEQMKQEAQQAVAAVGIGQIPGAGTDVLTPLNVKPSKYDNFLSQEYDGQISLVMPETARVEKQITGQISIDDVMAEWEEMKKSSEQKRMEEVRRRILEHTGNLFADFDEATKNGLLEELERAFVAAIMKDSDRKPSIKKVILPDDDARINSALDIVKSEAEQLVANAVSHNGLSDDIDDGVEELEEIEDIEESAIEESAAAASEKEISDAEEQPIEPASAGESADTAGGPSEEAVGDHTQDRELTEEEKALFGQFVHHRRSKRQLVHTLDNMSLASCTGNVIITGDEELTTLTLAKALIKEMQYNDNNFSDKIAKISANVLNKKDVAETFARLDNGALIIERASKLQPFTISKMTKLLEKDNMGILILLIDKKDNINQLLADHAELNNNFNLRVDIEPLNDEALVAYAKQYAEEMEYSIDEFGILALHTRIADRQTSDHEVSMAEIRDLIDEAIHYANKKTPKHFMDILLAKRYDEEDMIILRERDFMHY